MFLRKLMIGAALMLSAVSGARAVVIVDMSPDTIGGPAPGVNISNIATRQNFLVQFTLGSAATLGGIDIYSSYAGVTVGTGAIVKIRADIGGIPDTANLVRFVTTISALDSVGSTMNPSIKRVHADFGATRLAAGTYWIGLDGVSEIGLSLQFDMPDSSGLWILSNNSLLFSFENYAQAAFRVDGIAAVPEPASWSLLVTGFAFVGIAVRRRKVAAVA